MMKYAPVACVLPVLLLLMPASSSVAQDRRDIQEAQQWLETIPEPYKILYKVVWSEEERQQFREELDVTAISLSRSGCLGRCPVYEVTLQSDGSALYEGRYFVETTGVFEGEISLREFGRLAWLLESLEFGDMKNRYAAPWTDDEGYTVTVSYRGGRSRSVTSYGRYGPVELWGLARVIESLRDDIEWEKRAGDEE